MDSRPFRKVAVLQISRIYKGSFIKQHLNFKISSACSQRCVCFESHKKMRIVRLLSNRMQFLLASRCQEVSARIELPSPVVGGSIEIRLRQLRDGRRNPMHRGEIDAIEVFIRDGNGLC